MGLKQKELIDEIVAINRKCAEFWGDASDWAPPGAAELLSASRLDWQVSLSETLRLWTGEQDQLSDGEIILAWTNLGALVEGTMKFLFSVYYEDFQFDLKALKASNSFDHKKARPKSPDGLSLESLKVFATKKRAYSIVKRKGSLIWSSKDATPYMPTKIVKSAIRFSFSKLWQTTKTS